MKVSLVTYIGCFALLFWGLPAVAQVLHQELQETVKAEVLEIVDEYQRDIMGTGAQVQIQQLRVELLEGQKEGYVANLENELVTLEVGDVIFVNRLQTIDGVEYFIFKDIERRPQLMWVTGLLILLVIIFAGWQGIRALISVSFSIAAIIFLLVPALLAGHSPALTSLAISAVILAVTLFFTHGIKPRVVIAFLGTFSAVLITCLIAWLSVDWLKLTGFGSDASVYLNFSTGGTLDISGLLLGSIIIGLLGVLDDVSITQASVVQELRGANRELTFIELYRRAIRVGRDHVGSLVNTLALAYVGAALPLVLLFARTDASFFTSLNQEVVAAEVLRIVVGSIGLVLAVPFTTVMAAWYFKDKVVDNEPIPHCGHHHH